MALSDCEEQSTILAAGHENMLLSATKLFTEMNPEVTITYAITGRLES